VAEGLRLGAMTLRNGEGCRERRIMSQPRPDSSGIRLPPLILVSFFFFVLFAAAMAGVNRSHGS